ncbi:NADH:flavin oxidoreductase / NADH oxidase family protein [Halogranum amylolyticum]|uniref:NADH:flavin oxidoreductase / NADH oxidase family protein n=1 Tax=Halogranum amylolyticum TaxID=660520 RepID=A0A1H8VX45_9EURY|nr:NADH:flavin oxidoreductase / NADH oxidase family protein [Halogranum amylolyticum]
MTDTNSDPTDFAILQDDAPNDYEYQKLFEPTTIGGVDLRNRLMMTGHTTNYASGTELTETLRDYYVERGKGGDWTHCHGVSRKPSKLRFRKCDPRVG